MPTPPSLALPLLTRLGPARDRRLLDARRLPQLGHRPRLPALAPAQEGRRWPRRVDRRRRRSATCSRRRATAAWAKWLLDQGASCATSRGLRPRRTEKPVRPRWPTASTWSHSSVRGKRLLAAARVRGQTRCARSAPGSGTRERASPLRCIRSTPTPAVPRSPPRAYNTTIVAVNHAAFPYGGLDLARLFDARQEVAGSVGGTPPASLRRVDPRRQRPPRAGLAGGAQERRPLRHAAAADQGAVRGGRAGLELDHQRVRRSVHRPARHGHAQQLGGHGARVPSVRPEVDPVALGHHPPRLPRR